MKAHANSPNHGLLLRGEDGRVRLARPHPGIFNGDATAPFSHRLSVEVIALSQTRYAFFKPIPLTNTLTLRPLDDFLIKSIYTQSNLRR